MSSNSNNNELKISVADFLGQAPAEMRIEVLAGRAALREKFVSSAHIQKLGLALAGFADNTRAGCIQILGQSEISYLAQLESKRKTEAINNLDLEKICCILIAKNLEPLPELLDIAEKRNLPVLRTPLASSEAIRAAADFLSDALAPHSTIHGVLMEIYGAGILILGESGIGKSECALDLISAAHRLVADDAVVIKKIGDALCGCSPALTRELLEVRGLGIINVRELFGISAVAKQKEIKLCIEFLKRSDVVEIERLGLETQKQEILGVRITKFVLPVSAGRNLATLVETAVRLFLQGEDGRQNAAQKIIEKHTAIVGGK